ncbi:GerMN domain-containing protein [Helcococcus massiliensis]|uniref:GerMN domain-containing protein n=1 Tax=Helcococcus massiliensis TaxID=2040290 RepID=UPI000CDEBBB0|nr:GerMN domain-containing protein [Helcococcus massiliensis]
MKKKLSVLFAILLILTACGKTDDESSKESVKETSLETGKETTKESINETESEEEMMDLALYYILDMDNEFTLVREIHQLKKTDQVAKAAMEELISGKILTDKAIRPLPEHTKIHSINIKDGKAIIDFDKNVLDHAAGSSVEAESIQAIVNTITEFDNVKEVEFWVDGSKEKADNWWGHVGLHDLKLTRNLDRVWTPAIWLTHPKNGDQVSNKLRMVGSSMTFESTVGYTVKDKNGNILAEDTFTATGGDGMRRLFDISIDLKDPSHEEGTLEVYGISGKDGSPTDKVTVNIRFK